MDSTVVLSLEDVATRTHWLPDRRGSWLRIVLCGVHLVAVYTGAMLWIQDRTYMAGCMAQWLNASLWPANFLCFAFDL